MSKLEVKEIGPISGETDLKLGQAGGTVTLAAGAEPIGWDKAGYTAAYSMAAWTPDQDVQVLNGFMPILETSGTASSGTIVTVGQTPVGLDIIQKGSAETNVLKITHAGVYIIYSAASGRTNGSTTPVDKIWASAWINGEDTRYGDNKYVPPNFLYRDDSNATNYIYRATSNDVWTGLLDEGDEVQFGYYVKSKTGFVRVNGLVGSIIYVGDSD